jgi:predicted lysophospholipase L1 biosynthesis ABC-type transport system permease subunit
MRLLEQAMAAKADSILASDANFKKLAKAERILRHQLHQDRLNKPRSMQKVERLQRDLHEALAKAKECEDRIPMNEEKLADTLASKEAMRKACIAKLIQTEMAQLDGETSSA